MRKFRLLSLMICGVSVLGLDCCGKKEEPKPTENPETYLYEKLLSCNNGEFSKPVIYLYPEEFL